jgi:hypothetical protein
MGCPGPASAAGLPSAAGAAIFNGHKPEEDEGTGKSPKTLKNLRFRLIFGQDDQ